MRIKKDFMPCFLFVIMVLFFGLLAPASADFKKVNERELARVNASLTGQIGTILCPDPADAKELEESDCVAIPAKNEIVANEDSLSSVYTDYGYDWWKNLKVAGDLYYKDSSSEFSPLTVESGRDGDTIWARIGLGSQESEFDSWDGNVTVDCCSDGDCTYCQDQILGSLHLDGLTVKINGKSYVKLYIVEGHTGIGTDVDVTIDRIDLATFSWGDTDGFGKYTDAGYMGLKNTSITGVTAQGSVAIDVAKDDGVHAVHIGIANINVGMASLDTTVALGDKKDFSGTKSVLGTLYMKNLKMDVGGYVDIYSVTEESTTIGFDLKVPSLTLDTLSWGDADGFTTVGSFPGHFDAAGYIGLKDLAVKNLSIAGQVKFEEVCPNNAGRTNNNSLPVVKGVANIDFDVNMRVGYITTDIALGDQKDNLNQSLGTFSKSNVSWDVTGNVKISAH